MFTIVHLRTAFLYLSFPQGVGAWKWSMKSWNGSFEADLASLFTANIIKTVFGVSSPIMIRQQTQLQRISIPGVKRQDLRPTRHENKADKNKALEVIRVGAGTSFAP